MDTLQNLLCKLNRVTAVWRHQKRVVAKDMVALCNAQVEYEFPEQGTPQTEELATTNNIASPKLPCDTCGHEVTKQAFIISGYKFCRDCGRQLSGNG